MHSFSLIELKEKGPQQGQRIWMVFCYRYNGFFHFSTDRQTWKQLSFGWGSTPEVKAIVSSGCSTDPVLFEIRESKPSRIKELRGD